MRVGSPSTLKKEESDSSFILKNCIYWRKSQANIDENGNIVATATFIEQVLTIEFNTDYLYTPDINVSYSARLNENTNISESVMLAISLITDIDINLIFYVENKKEQKTAPWFFYIF